MKHFTVCILFCLSIILSCGSKQENPIISTSDILTSAPWTKIRNLEDIDLDGSFVQFGDDCENDDFWIFRPTGKFEHNNGLEACDGVSDPNSVLGTADWELQDNDQFLNLSFAVDDIKLKIISASENEIKFELIEDNNPPGIITQQVILNR